MSQEEKFTSPAQDPRYAEAIQRGIDRAKADLEHPELQQLPMPRIPEADSAQAGTGRAVLGSRAIAGAARIAAGEKAPEPKVLKPSNPYGRSPGSLSAEDDILKHGGR